jgi:quinate dehydrogenase
MAPAAVTKPAQETTEQKLSLVAPQDTQESSFSSTLYPTSHLDRVSYLFGHPIAHSLSPLFHQTIYDHLSLNWAQILHESKSIPSFMALTKDPKFFGAAVTMPHKVAIIPHLDKLTPTGQAVGSINTVFWEEQEDGSRLLVGTNTDCIGVREGIRQNIPAETYQSFKGKPAAIVGGGGTSRAAVYALVNWMGCSPVYFINRDQEEIASVIAGCKSAGFGDNLVPVTSAAHAATLPKPAVIVSAVPDFEPRSPSEIDARESLKIMVSGETPGVLLEMCYHPSSNTAVSRIAKGEGWQVIPGTEAMIWQGLEQDTYWTGKRVEELPVEEVKRAIHEALGRH